MIESLRPVIAVGATRTTAGRSQTTRHPAALLAARGVTCVVVRHPRSYGDLIAKRVQRYAKYDDLERYETTLDAREEYQPHLAAGRIVYAGVDYLAILDAAEPEADVILWDGGGDDFPFYRPDMFIVVADPVRHADARQYQPGDTNIHMADVVIINWVDSAEPTEIAALRRVIHELNPRADILTARSEPAPIDSPPGSGNEPGGRVRYELVQVSSTPLPRSWSPSCACFRGPRWWPCEIRPRRWPLGRGVATLPGVRVGPLGTAFIDDRHSCARADRAIVKA